MEFKRQNAKFISYIETPPHLRNNSNPGFVRRWTSNGWLIKTFPRGEDTALFWHFTSISICFDYPRQQKKSLVPEPNPLLHLHLIKRAAASCRVSSLAFSLGLSPLKDWDSAKLEFNLLPSCECPNNPCTAQLILLLLIHTTNICTR